MDVNEFKCLKKTILMNKVEFLEITVFFLVRPETFRVMCQCTETFRLLEFQIHQL